MTTYHITTHTMHINAELLVLLDFSLNLVSVELNVHKIIKRTEIQNIANSSYELDALNIDTFIVKN